MYGLFVSEGMAASGFLTGCARRCGTPVDIFRLCGYNGAKAMIGRVACMQAQREGRPWLRAAPQRSA